MNGKYQNMFEALDHIERITQEFTKVKNRPSRYNRFTDILTCRCFQTRVAHSPSSRQDMVKNRLKHANDLKKNKKEEEEGRSIFDQHIPNLSQSSETLRYKKMIQNQVNLTLNDDQKIHDVPSQQSIFIQKVEQLKVEENKLEDDSGCSVEFSGSDDDFVENPKENWFFRKWRYLLIPPTNRKLIYFHYLVTLAFFGDFFMTSLVIGNIKSIEQESVQDEKFAKTKLVSEPDFLAHHEFFNYIIFTQVIDIILCFFKIVGQHPLEVTDPIDIIS